MGINHPISQFFMPNLKSEFISLSRFSWPNPGKDFFFLVYTGWAKKICTFSNRFPDKTKLQLL
jgi:hypothetical protein